MNHIKIFKIAIYKINAIVALLLLQISLRWDFDIGVDTAAVEIFCYFVHVLFFSICSDKFKKAATYTTPLWGRKVKPCGFKSIVTQK